MAEGFLVQVDVGGTTNDAVLLREHSTTDPYYIPPARAALLQSRDRSGGPWTATEVPMTARLRTNAHRAATA